MMSQDGFPDLPPVELAQGLAAQLAGPRSRLLRRAAIGRRRAVLDVGCGWGVVTCELVQRAPRAVVVGLDQRTEAFASRPELLAGARRVAADLHRMPFGAGAFDLALCQNVLLWATDLPVATAELARVLGAGGVAIAIEPEYGGMLEWPEQGLAEVYCRALRRAGADPLIGRKLPGALEAAGFAVTVEFVPEAAPMSPEALDVMAGLPLTEAERARLAKAREGVEAGQATWSPFAHVPYVLVYAVRP
jgi:SAM-dependent methyltransferase